MRFQGQAVVVVELGWSGRVCGDVTLVGDEGCEEGQLHLRQALADAATLAQGEEEHTAGPVFVQRSGVVQETLGVEGLRVGPHGWVVVGGPLVDEDHRVLWYAVAHYGGVRGSGVGDGERGEAREAHHLVDEGSDVRQPRLVLDGGQSTAVHHFVHLLLETRLHLRVPALACERHFIKRQ